MKKKIFIDGKEGTTGLRIYDRLESREDIELLVLPEELRKDSKSRKEMLNSADVVFLCLPDDAAREAVSMIENENVTVIDASTAHRTLDGWAYGFPELSKEFEEKILNSKRIAVPGCHASGFIALVKPLIDNGFINKDIKLTCHSITGYSGGGKKMISEYEGEERNILLDAPRQYALTQNHKHLKEIKAICSLDFEPIFCPIVSDFYSGMTVTVPIFKSDLINGYTKDDIINLYTKNYNSELVKYKAISDSFISGLDLGNKDSMEISVLGNEDRILLIARYDNLGKGASGAAIELLNMKLNSDKTKGLTI